MAKEIVPNIPATKNTEETTGTENLVRQHMADQNHIITEEDMMKVEIGKFDVNEVGEENLSSLEDHTSKDEKKTGQDGDQPPPTTPWAIIE